MTVDRGVFLQADWRYLAMLNFRVEPELLQEFIPFGTELDFWNGETYVSIVGFLFLKTRVLRISFPFHSNFEEVNLRFYVRRRVGDEVRRAAVFIQELVPRFAVAWTARHFYNENYFAARMSHTLEHSKEGARFRLDWHFRKTAHFLSVEGSGEPQPLIDGSHEQFIAEHYWGYSSQPNGDTIEYQVRHPSWRAWRPVRYECGIDFRAQYGDRFAGTLLQEPVSVFLAEGSAVTISRGRRLRRSAPGTIEDQSRAR